MKDFNSKKQYDNFQASFFKLVTVLLKPPAMHLCSCKTRTIKLNILF